MQPKEIKCVNTFNYGVINILKTGYTTRTPSICPVNIVNQFSSETLQKICLSCHEVVTIIALENVMKVYTFLRRNRYKKLAQLCVKLFPNRNRND